VVKSVEQLVKDRNKKTSNDLLGFCGYLEFPTMHFDPQLAYAMFERFSGKGYATEMARAVITDARNHAGFREIIASVDEINAASLRVLDKLGFIRFSTQKGHFGNMFLKRLRDYVSLTHADSRRCRREQPWCQYCP